MLLNFAAAAVISLSAAALPAEPANYGSQNTSYFALEQSIVETITPAEIAALSPIENISAKPASSALGVFRSVAISAARIPAARKWREVQNTDFSHYFGSDCADSGASGCNSRFVKTIRSARDKAAGLPDREMLNVVNRAVNAAMTYSSDRAVWGVGDYWANPLEMASKGAGDCEDYAIAKYWLLRSLGISDQNLQMVLLQDTRRQLFHAVLVVHTASGAYVLDNVTNRLQFDTAYSQYQPIMSFTGGRSYIHGFEAGRTITAMPSDLSAVAPGSGM